MEIVEVEVYSFDELDDKAKERARNWFRDGLEYPWFSDCKTSITTFVEHFGGCVLDYELGGNCRGFIKTNVTHENFRGLKLKDFKQDHMPTGYCLDCSLWGTFHQLWKRTGDPFYAYREALEAAVLDIEADIDYHFSDECIDEMLTFNHYRFTVNGKVF